ncbi:MAG TPA: hypothetical protein ENI15_02730 [Spirochaetes bacterium]|nr:hypothetical protein [Spirochaetota bacterium]
MSVSVEEFMRRFLLHVIPKRFMRIRFYGLLSNRNKKEMLIKLGSYFTYSRSFKRVINFLMRAPISLFISMPE